MLVLRVFVRLIVVLMIVTASVLQVVKLLSRALPHQTLAFVMTEEVYDFYYILRLYDARTGIHYHFTPDHDRIYDFVWTPDGNDLILQMQYVLNEEIYLTRNSIAPHQQAVLVSDELHSSALPMTWSPSGDEIVLGRLLNYLRPELSIQTLDMASGTLHDIDYPSELSQPTMAEWMPDARHLLVRDNFLNADYQFALIDPDYPSEPQGLATGLNPYSYAIPHPDGSGLILLSEHDIAFASMDDLSHPETLISGTTSYLNMALSPDGNQLAYIELRNRSTRDSAIHVLDLNTRQSEEVTSLEGVILGIAWSADGEWLAYNYLPTRTGQSFHSIYIIHPDGTGQRHIASGFMQNFHRRYLQWQP